MYPGSPNPVQVQFVPSHCEENPPNPLVLIHDGGGAIFSYFLLGALNRDVWAIYNPKYFEGEAWEGGIDEMAHHYVDLIIKTGLKGNIILGGWSLGALISLQIARILANESSAPITITSFLLIDSPYHIAEKKLTVSTSPLNLEGFSDLAVKSIEHTVAMLQDWDLPSWDGPSGGGANTVLTADGRDFTVQPESILYKPVGQDWKFMKTKDYQFPDLKKPRVCPPPGVMIRCTQMEKKKQGAGPEPTVIDLYRNETLLGWEWSYPNFLKAVIDIEGDHYSIFDEYDTEMVPFSDPLSQIRGTPVANISTGGDFDVAGQFLP